MERKKKERKTEYVSADGVTGRPEEVVYTMCAEAYFICDIRNAHDVNYLSGGFVWLRIVFGLLFFIMRIMQTQCLLLVIIVIGLCLL